MLTVHVAGGTTAAQDGKTGNHSACGIISKFEDVFFTWTDLQSGCYARR